MNRLLFFRRCLAVCFDVLFRQFIQRLPQLSDGLCIERILVQIRAVNQRRNLADARQQFELFHFFFHTSIAEVSRITTLLILAGPILFVNPFSY